MKTEPHYLNLYVSPCSNFETEDGLKIINPTKEWFHVFVAKTTDPVQPVDVDHQDIEEANPDKIEDGTNESAE